MVGCRGWLLEILENFFGGWLRLAIALKFKVFYGRPGEARGGHGGGRARRDGKRRHRARKLPPNRWEPRTPKLETERRLEVQREQAKVPNLTGLEHASHNTYTNYVLSLLQARFRAYEQRQKAKETAGRMGFLSKKGSRSSSGGGSPHRDGSGGMGTSLPPMPDHIPLDSPIVIAVGHGELKEGEDADVKVKTVKGVLAVSAMGGRIMAPGPQWVYVDRD